MADVQGLKCQICMSMALPLIEDRSSVTGFVLAGDFVRYGLYAVDLRCPHSPPFFAFNPETVDPKMTLVKTAIDNLWKEHSRNGRVLKVFDNGTASVVFSFCLFILPLRCIVMVDEVLP